MGQPPGRASRHQMNSRIHPWVKKWRGPVVRSILQLAFLEIRRYSGGRGHTRNSPKFPFIPARTSLPQVPNRSGVCDRRRLQIAGHISCNSGQGRLAPICPDLDPRAWGKLDSFPLGNFVLIYLPGPVSIKIKLKERQGDHR